MQIRRREYANYLEVEMRVIHGTLRQSFFQRNLDIRGHGQFGDDQFHVREDKSECFIGLLRFQGFLVLLFVQGEAEAHHRN